jgi:hydrogenase-4 component J
MAERVVFYQLTHKFVNQDRDIPEDARQVVYYSLAIGHHVGVMDCFQSLMEIPLEQYRQWVSRLPEGTSRRKLEGLLKFGEIEINHSHANDLLGVLNDSSPALDASQTGWTGDLVQCLKKMIQEPALYLMVRKFA